MSLIAEYYEDYNTWSQWLVRTLFSFLIPRFDIKQLKVMVKKESEEPTATLPEAICKEYVVSLLENAACRTHVISPKDSKSNVTIIDFHGGAYIANFSAMHFLSSVDIMKILGVPCTFVLPEYPLAPDTTHEILFDVVERVYRQIALEYLQNDIIVLGDSAGGGIALVLCQRLAAARKLGDKVRQPAGLVLLSPWLDVSMTNPDCGDIEKDDPFLTVVGLKTAGEMLAGGPSPVSTIDPAVSPLYGSLHGLPPTTVFTSSNDLLMPDSRRLLARFKEEGIPTRLRYYEKKGIPHCYFLYPGAGRVVTLGQIVHAIREDCGIKN